MPGQAQSGREEELGSAPGTGAGIGAGTHGEHGDGGDGDGGGLDPVRVLIILGRGALDYTYSAVCLLLACTVTNHHLGR